MIRTIGPFEGTVQAEDWCSVLESHLGPELNPTVVYQWLIRAVELSVRRSLSPSRLR